MIYLFDANTLINANDFYYPFDRIPQYWDWLIHQGNNGQIKIPQEIYDEITSDSTDFDKWLKNSQTKDALILKEAVNLNYLNQVYTNGYLLPQPLKDTDLEKIAKDSFLIAYALNNPMRTIVTKEVLKPNKVGANKKIPDVCDTLGIAWMDDFNALRQLGFTIP